MTAACGSSWYTLAAVRMLLAAGWQRAPQPCRARLLLREPAGAAKTMTTTTIHKTRTPTRVAPALQSLLTCGGAGDGGGMKRRPTQPCRRHLASRLLWCRRRGRGRARGRELTAAVKMRRCWLTTPATLLVLTATTTQMAARVVLQAAMLPKKYAAARLGCGGGRQLGHAVTRLPVRGWKRETALPGRTLAGRHRIRRPHRSRGAPAAAGIAPPTSRPAA